MDIINTKYYDGFEGEPELQLIRVSDSGERNILSLWNAYLEVIMHSMIPNNFDEKQLCGLVYCYFKHEGWYDESPWKIPDINDALRQFESFDTDNLTDDEKKSLNNVLKDVPEVLTAIVQFLKKAKELSEVVYIAYE